MASKLSTSESEGALKIIASAAEKAADVISSAANKATDAIGVSTARATDALAAAAIKATEALASAALSASKVVSSNAAVAEETNKSNVKNTQIDHDLLVRLDTKMETLIADVRAGKDDTARKIEHIEGSKLEVVDSYPKLYKEGVEKNIADNTNDIKALQLLSVKIMTWGGIIAFLIGISDVVMKFIK